MQLVVGPKLLVEQPGPGPAVEVLGDWRAEAVEESRGDVEDVDSRNVGACVNIRLEGREIAFGKDPLRGIA